MPTESHKLTGAVMGASCSIQASAFEVKSCVLTTIYVVRIRDGYRRGVEKRSSRRPHKSKIPGSNPGSAIHCPLEEMADSPGSEPGVF